jgi:hypothetical protein
VKKSCGAKKKDAKIVKKNGFSSKIHENFQIKPVPKPQSKRHAVMHHHDALVDSIST